MMKIPLVQFGLALTAIAVGLAPTAGAQDVADTELPRAQPVPAVQVIPLPYDQASFRWHGSELTRFHFGQELERPFLYPVNGASGWSLTRMGHPHDPVGHSHHNSVWMSHHDVEGHSFWADSGQQRIVCRRILRYDDGDTRATALAEIAWIDPQGAALLEERRAVSVVCPAGAAVDPTMGFPREYWIVIDSRFQPAGEQPVTFGETPFGLIGVRMAKTIGVHDGGGRILDSEGRRDEEAIFRRPARWVDYSGPVASGSRGGITLMDHPDNPGFPTPFHVRNDGWMGACLTLTGPITLEVGDTLCVRYGLWVHAEVSDRKTIEERWRKFREFPAVELDHP